MRSAMFLHMVSSMPISRVDEETVICEAMKSETSSMQSHHHRCFGYSWMGERGIRTLSCAFEKGLGLPTAVA